MLGTKFTCEFAPVSSTVSQCIALIHLYTMYVQLLRISGACKNIWMS
jgi:hypothetical protein